jgi:hypothetical protein
MEASPPQEEPAAGRDELVSDLNGRVLESGSGSSERSERLAAIAAVAVNHLAVAGDTAGLSGLALLVVKSSDRSLTIAVQPNALRVTIVGPPPVGPDGALQSPLADSFPPPPLAAPDPEPAAPAPEKPQPAGDPWFTLRKALIRGQLTEATTQLRNLDALPPVTEPPAGAELLDPAERDRAVQVLLGGIGCVMASDGVGGCRILRELTLPSARNLSFRWLAHHWSAWGAIKSGTQAAGRIHVREALALAKQLGGDAEAATHWTAAAVLADSPDPTRALAWLNQARAGFERLQDGWGLGQSWLLRARILAAAGRERESVEAAHQARASDLHWDEPAIFLARRALMRGDAASAEEILRALDTPAADRLRAALEAIRAGHLSQADAAEFLSQSDSSPSPQAFRTLVRIARESPGFLPAREALAWMLLKVGRYANAAAIFRALLRSQLAPAERASVMLGLSCITNAEQANDAADKQVLAAMNADEPPAASDSDSSPNLGLASSVLSANGGVAPASSAGAIFSGSLSGFPLPDLLEFLRGAKRTGLLICNSSAGVAGLRLRSGWIVGAVSPGTPDLGTILISEGHLSAEALQALASRSGGEQPDQALAELLLGEGLSGAEAIKGALARRIDLAVRELLHWTSGDFAFSDDSGGQTDPRTSVAVDPQAVLLNAFKDQDEASRGAR